MTAALSRPRCTTACPERPRSSSTTRTATAFRSASARAPFGTPPATSSVPWRSSTTNAARLAARERIAELERAALLDPVTDLGNRRYGEIQLGLDARRAPPLRTSVWRPVLRRRQLQVGQRHPRPRNGRPRPAQRGAHRSSEPPPLRRPVPLGGRRVPRHHRPRGRDQLARRGGEDPHPRPDLGRLGRRARPCGPPSPSAAPSAERATRSTRSSRGRISRCTRARKPGATASRS